MRCPSMTNYQPIPAGLHPPSTPLATHPPYTPWGGSTHTPMRGAAFNELSEML
jgi:hypothetical protein